jgi:hypothetical protein
MMGAAGAQTFLPYRSLGVDAPLCWYKTYPGSIVEEPTQPGNVLSLYDMMPNGFNLSQSTVINQPTVDNSIWGGKTTIAFDGSSEWLENAGFTITSFPCTIIAIVSFADLTGSESAMGFGSSIDNDEYAFAGKSSDNPIGRVESGIFFQTATSPFILTVNEPVMIEVEIPDESTRLVRVNRGDLDTDTGFEAFPAQSNLIVIGKRPGNGTSNDMDGNFGEGGIFDRILTSDQLDDIYLYAQRVWGV